MWFFPRLFECCVLGKKFCCCGKRTNKQHTTPDMESEARLRKQSPSHGCVSTSVQSLPHDDDCKILKRQSGTIVYVVACRRVDGTVIEMRDIRVVGTKPVTANQVLSVFQRDAYPELYAAEVVPTNIVRGHVLYPIGKVKKGDKMASDLIDFAEVLEPDEEVPETSPERPIVVSCRRCKWYSLSHSHIYTHMFHMFCRVLGAIS